MTQSRGAYAEHEAGASDAVPKMCRGWDFQGLHWHISSAKLSKVGSSKGCLTSSVVSLEDKDALQGTRASQMF